MLDRYGDDNVEFALIGHSIGGWVARAWLSEWTSPKIKEKVTSLITLGSPHQPPPSSSFFSSADQTRGLLTYINTNFPGAFEPKVAYTSVISSAYTGELPSLKSSSLSPLFLSLLAFASYSLLSGEGTSSGDALIPISTATLDGAKLLVVEVILIF